MLIAPEGTPAKDRTCASFMSIAAVADRPSSVLTWDSDMAPEAGNVII
jgi:hypothetical protein